MSKTIVITGGSKGIGAATTLELAKQGHHIYILSRDSERMEVIKQQAKSLHADAKITPLAIDLSSDEVGKVLDLIPSLDILINNAGYLINKSFDQLCMEDWEYSFEINFFAVVKIIRALQPKMKGGHILNISSMGGFQGSPKFDNLAAYSASKAALSNLTETLAPWMSQRNIGINCLALGAVQTDMLSTAFPQYQAPITPKDLAPFIAYFALNGHHFFQGKILPVALSTP